MSKRSISMTLPRGSGSIRGENKHRVYTANTLVVSAPSPLARDLHPRLTDDDLLKDLGWTPENAHTDYGIRAMERKKNIVAFCNHHKGFKSVQGGIHSSVL